MVFSISSSWESHQAPGHFLHYLHRASFISSRDHPFSDRCQASSQSNSSNRTQAVLNTNWSTLVEIEYSLSVDKNLIFEPKVARSVHRPRNRSIGIWIKLFGFYLTVDQNKYRIISILAKVYQNHMWICQDTQISTKSSYPHLNLFDRPEN